MASTDTALKSASRAGSQPFEACDLAAEAKAIRAAVDADLASLTGTGCGPSQLTEAMRHGLLAPAKRVRSILLVLTADRFDVPRATSVRAATAIEMVHAASLVFDDLPAMDDATMRRGRPTTHRTFGDATAILAAISLMNAGYEALAGLDGVGAERRCQSVGLLTRAIGPGGLCGGQHLDLASTGIGDLDAVEAVHAGKTGALFAASMAIGATVGAPLSGAARAFWDAGMAVGLAFQGYDDLLDAYASAGAIGKDCGLDAGKATIATVLGRRDGEAWARARLNEALSLLTANGHGHSTLSDYIRHLAGLLTAPLNDGASGPA